MINERIRTYTYLYEKKDKIFCEDFWQLPEACAERAAQYAQMGFTAVKLDPFAPYLDDYTVHMPARETLLRAEKTVSEIRRAIGAFCVAHRTLMRFRADVVRSITDALKHLL